MPRVKGRSIDKRLTAALQARETDGHRRSLSHLSGIDFCSNDYLGLARIECKADHDNSSTKHSLGSTGSRLISGNSRLCEQVERQISQFHGFEQGLLFNSGYAANMGLLASLGQRGDTFLMDDKAHASLIDGARLSFAARRRFKHNDLDDLQRQLAHFTSPSKSGSDQSGQVFVVVESIYSMDGDQAPLQEIASLCEQYQATLIVDEAHALGVIGTRGQGLVSALGLCKQVFAAVYTFGKAMGCHGALVAGSETLCDYLINYCRPFIYTTAPSPQTVSAISFAHQQLVDADRARAALRENLDYFSERLKSSQFPNTHWLGSNSPIQGLIISGASRAKTIESNLQKAGFAIKAIMSPTVEEGQERLRICVHSFNTRDQIDQLAEQLNAQLKGGA